MQQVRIVIIGGGFAGVRCAKVLAQKLGNKASITLVSDSPHFIYHGNLYRVATGKTPSNAAIPLTEIFAGTKVALAHDTIVEFDHLHQVARGRSGAQYFYDYVVIAAGNVAASANSVENASVFQFKTLHDALSLHQHIHEVLDHAVLQAPASHNRIARFFVVGAGLSGIELASELALYIAKIVPAHHIAKGTVQISLVEKAPQIMPGFDQSVRTIVTKRLEHLGVAIKTNTTVDQLLQTPRYIDRSPTIDAIVWTVGTAACDFVTKWNLPHDEKCKITVNNNLQVTGLHEVYAIGDIANISDSGRATSALRQAEFVAAHIDNTIQRKATKPYTPQTDWPIIPIGTGFAVAVINKTVIRGKIGWYLRRLFDLVVYAKFLPLHKALSLVPYNDEVQETCKVCSEKKSI